MTVVCLMAIICVLKNTEAAINEKQLCEEIK